MQPIKRHHDIGGVGNGIQVFRHGGAARCQTKEGWGAATGFLDRNGRIAELARSRDHGHRLDQSFSSVGIGQRAEYLKTDLRQTVAEGAQGQIFNHHIGGAAIGGRIGGPHPGRHERIRVLGFVARIPAPCDATHVHRLAIGPDPANAGDLAFAERDRETGIVEIFGGHDLATPTALAAALAGGICLLAEIRGPDDVATHPHAAKETRDYGPFGRGGHAHAVEPRALDALRRCEG